ncbi:hypothetical protein A7P25_08435 [Achromobacter xylosoxidans]|uniref:Uncharacterized protein n=1 Tax=Achromobacter ruhlandii TaxID=72557 RepID=A0A2M9H206_9BURK|nr:hypothetical protein [Achromobacter ruhlandii]OCZ61006.1 hypothetical protein A7P23_09590 [Achromobacter xylosoxidans]OCZ69506.1 hypothetical protein A9G00_43150 [Achromobacter xylosoxidans]OCZ83504.1 hypothetical protein A7P25_08435 [Achromobacter xylosoxidans]PJM70858.1 hypothetical protein CV751_08405 [Achromobacter ruhlandii]CAB3898441.1 hypothetical protein LMG3328_04164 [Achromobacter ruhlandii]
MKIRHYEPYAPLRARAYPAIGDQLDAIMKFAAHLQASGQALPAEVTQWVAQCQGVKQRYPKPVIDAEGGTP